MALVALVIAASVAIVAGWWWYRRDVLVPVELIEPVTDVQPEICPTCEGQRTVQWDLRADSSTETDLVIMPCTGCNGLGIVACPYQSWHRTKLR